MGRVAGVGCLILMKECKRWLKRKECQASEKLETEMQAQQRREMMARDISWQASTIQFIELKNIVIMSNEITEDDLLEMEAYGQSIIDKARRLRAKLQPSTTIRGKNRISPERIARVEMERTKLDIKRAERYAAANKK